MNAQYHTFSLVQGRLDLELIPNRGVSGFSLGKDISKILQVLEQNLVVLTKINFMVNQNSHTSSPIILEIKPYQLFLIFDPNTQLLQQIILKDLTKVNLRIKNYTISSHKICLTSSLVHKILGPTFPGTYDHKNLRYTINYPGISFIFNIPDKFANMDFNNMELEFPDHTAPQCHTVTIQFATPIPTNEIEAPFIQQFHLSEPKLLLATILPDAGINVKIINPNKGFKVETFSIRFHITSSQDLHSDLGPPPQIYYNQEDYMRLHVIPTDQHSQSTPAHSTSIRQNTFLNPTDYFYNYYHLGMDLLLDGVTNCVKKIILHTNAPNHFNFNVYQKCHFQLVNDVMDINANSKWSDIEKMMGQPIGRPVLFDRGYGKYQNPFPPSTLRGYSNMIFEVLNNEHLASITLFQSTRPKPELINFPSPSPSIDLQSSPNFQHSEQLYESAQDNDVKELKQAHESPKVPQVLSPEQRLDEVVDIGGEKDLEMDDVKEIVNEKDVNVDNNQDIVSEKSLQTEEIHEIVTETDLQLDEVQEIGAEDHLQSDNAQEIIPEMNLESNEIQDIVPERDSEPDAAPSNTIQSQHSFHSENFQFSNNFSTSFDSPMTIDNYSDEIGFTDLIREASSNSIFQDDPIPSKTENEMIPQEDAQRSEFSDPIPSPIPEEPVSTNINQNEIEEVEIDPYKYDEPKPVSTTQSTPKVVYFKQAFDNMDHVPKHKEHRSISPVQESPKETSTNHQYTAYFKPYKPSPSFSTSYSLPQTPSTDPPALQSRVSNNQNLSEITKNDFTHQQESISEPDLLNKTQIEKSQIFSFPKHETKSNSKVDKLFNNGDDKVNKLASLPKDQSKSLSDVGIILQNINRQNDSIRSLLKNPSRSSSYSDKSIKKTEISTNQTPSLSRQVSDPLSEHLLAAEKSKINTNESPSTWKHDLQFDNESRRVFDKLTKQIEGLNSTQSQKYVAPSLKNNSQRSVPNIDKVLDKSETIPSKVSFPSQKQQPKPYSNVDKVLNKSETKPGEISSSPNDQRVTSKLQIPFEEENESQLNQDYKFKDTESESISNTESSKASSTNSGSESETIEPVLIPTNIKPIKRNTLMDKSQSQSFSNITKPEIEHSIKFKTDPHSDSSYNESSSSPESSTRASTGMHKSSSKKGKKNKSPSKSKNNTKW